MPVTGAAGAAGTVQAPLDPANYRFLQEFVYRESGIVLDGDKHYLIEARLMPVIHRARLASLDALCEALRADGIPDLRVEVVNAITTNETHFFRDPAQYEALRKVVLPRLIEDRGAGRRLSFWSAAASTGQEAYSLAMMLREMDLGGWNITILATDLSTHVLRRAREGKYMQIEVNRGLPVACLVKWFTREGLEWRLKEEIRRMVRFEHLDLRQNTGGLGPFDVVFCRNVLIYFDTETKKRILAGIRRALFGGGYLLLGGSETTLGIDASFTRETVGSTVLHRSP